jgi:hypothetical protein
MENINEFTKEIKSEVLVVATEILIATLCAYVLVIALCSLIFMAVNLDNYIKLENARTEMELIRIAREIK